MTFLNGQVRAGAGSAPLLARASDDGPAGGVSPAPRARVRVKICGITRLEDARFAAAAGADMLGFNFWAGSVRHVDTHRAAEIARTLPEEVWRVGVFVNASREEIERTRAAVGLTAIQLHGDEPPDLLRGFPAPVIRAVRLRSARDAAAARQAPRPDYFLCEGDPGSAYGGRGASFEWSWAREFPAEQLFVAGGLTPENVADAVRALRPFAVDVASGVESSPGIKEPARVAAFIDNAKGA